MSDDKVREVATKLVIDSWKERAMLAESKVRRLRDCVEEMAREIAYMAIYRTDLPPEEAREYASQNWRKYVPALYAHIFEDKV